VYILLITVFLLGVCRILESVWNFRAARREPPEVRAPVAQAALWAILLICSIGAFSTGHSIVGVLVLVVAVMLPVNRRKKPPKGTEDWPEAKPPDKALPTESPKVN